MGYLSQDELDRYKRMSDQKNLVVLPGCVEELYDAKQHIAEVIDNRYERARRGIKFYRAYLGYCALSGTAVAVFAEEMNNAWAVKYAIAAVLVAAAYSINNARHDRKIFKQDQHDLRVDYWQVDAYYSVALDRAIKNNLNIGVDRGFEDSATIDQV